MEETINYRHTDLTKHCKQRYVERIKGITSI
jgi:hypothetical protein